MMPGDFKAMKAIKDMKVMKRKQVEKRMAMKAMQRMLEGYARARSKLLFEKEAMQRMSDGYAAAKANLLAKMAAEEARSSTARPSSARFDTCGHDDSEDAFLQSEAMIEHSKVLDAIVEAQKNVITHNAMNAITQMMSEGV